LRKQNRNRHKEWRGSRPETQKRSRQETPIRRTSQSLQKTSDSASRRDRTKLGELFCVSQEDRGQENRGKVMSVKPKIIRLDSAEYAGANKLHLLFSDGKEKVVDFGPFLENSQHPQIRKYLNPRRFKKFTVEDGELMWGNFDMIFPIMDLYKNKLERAKKTIGKSGS
jgi:hypothetical protein